MLMWSHPRGTLLSRGRDGVVPIERRDREVSAADHHCPTQMQQCLLCILLQQLENTKKNWFVLGVGVGGKDGGGGCSSVWGKGCRGHLGPQNPCRAPGGVAATLAGVALHFDTKLQHRGARADNWGKIRKAQRIQWNFSVWLLPKGPGRIKNIRRINSLPPY